jgi:hypothetical protein
MHEKRLLLESEKHKMQLQELEEEVRVREQQMQILDWAREKERRKIAVHRGK